jgi:hypothetical protein
MGSQTIDTRKVHNHGDIILIPVAGWTTPATSVRADVHVLQSSGVTGNRHEVAGKGTSSWREGDREFLFCPEVSVLRHVGGDCEHGEQVLEAGAWEVKHEDEHDPFTGELRRVID